MRAETVEPKLADQAIEEKAEINKEMDQSVNETFLTTNDRTVDMHKTLNMTMYTANDDSAILESQPDELRRRDKMIGELHLQIAEVESVWRQKCATLQDKVK